APLRPALPPIPASVCARVGPGGALSFPRWPVCHVAAFWGAPMPSADADRNLLFGILALQMDFIGRDALIAAMHAWVLDKAKPLGQIFREQQALDDQEHALLDALVRKHLQRHGDDPAKSLAAVSSLGAARGALQQVADPEVHASLAAVTCDYPRQSWAAFP